MNKSESIANLAAALSSLQGEIQDAHKDKSGYGYKYADLSSILDIARPLLTKHKLAVSQLCSSLQSVDQEGKLTLTVSVETVLMEASGEWISSELYMPITQGKGMNLAQAAGSVITYARRYALAAVLGIAQTDNDASIKEAPPEESHDKVAYLKLMTLIFDKKLEDKVPTWCKHFNIERLQDISNEQMKQLITRIEETN